jgi:hypothetical protein
MYNSQFIIHNFHQAAANYALCIMNYALKKILDDEDIYN